jgi:hypothetical protein
MSEVMRAIQAIRDGLPVSEAEGLAIVAELARLRDENARLRAACRAARQIALDAVTDAGDRNAPPAMLAVCQAIPADLVGLAACPDIVEISGEWWISTPWGEELLDGPYPTREAAAQSAAGLDSPPPAP